MDDYFKSSDYLSYLIAHCNDTAGGAHGRVAGGDQIRGYLARLSIKPGDRILEVGCGTGRVMDIIHRSFGALPQGCDVSPAALAYLEETRPHFAGRTRSLDSHGLAVYPSDSFDLVIYWGAFELVPQRAHLAELARMLVRGGRAMLSSLKHARPFADDADAQAALAAYKAKAIPIATGEPEAFERVLKAFGFAVDERLVFERKSDLTSDRFSVDMGGARTFSEAIYVIRKTGDAEAALPFSQFHGA